MGLAGRKVKQRIGNDPRNLSWADDASRFGQAYLAKFGWDASKGLGASGEGRTSALKATQKLDMLGIGMQHQNDPDGIAWRQNRDFENVLRRLNNETTVEASGMGLFHKADEGGEVAAMDDSNGERTTTKKDKKREKGKKRKVVEREEEKTIDKEGSDDKKKRKKRRKSRNDDGQRVSDVAHEAEASSQSALPMVASVATPTKVVPQALPIRAPPRTHRARIIAAKRMAASNSTALAEILGIPAPSSSSSSSSSPSPAAFTATPSSSSLPKTTTAEAQDQLQNLTTATQSVGDYFKAKLSAKAQQQQKPTAAAQNDDISLSRAGLGASRSLPTETTCSSEQARGGIGSSRFAAMFALGQVASDTWEVNVDVDAMPRHDATDCDEEDRRKNEKKRTKEERRKAKEKGRRREAEARSMTAAGSQLNGEIMDVPVDVTPDGGTKRRKKRREAEALDSRLEGAPSSGLEGIPTKKRKKRDKDRKSRKHRGPEE